MIIIVLQKYTKYSMWQSDDLPCDCQKGNLLLKQINLVKIYKFMINIC